MERKKAKNNLEMVEMLIFIRITKILVSQLAKFWISYAT